MAPLWAVLQYNPHLFSFSPHPVWGPVHEIQTAQYLDHAGNKALYLDQVIKRSDWLILANCNNIRLLLYHHSGFCLLLKALVIAKGKINIIESCFNLFFFIYFAYILVLADIF